MYWWKTNRYDGTGDPWAGQESYSGMSEASSSVELLDFPEKFGADPPTGSAIELCIIWHIWRNRWLLSWTKNSKPELILCQKINFHDPKKISKQTTNSFQENNSTDLYEGIGDPWAGQDKLYGWREAFVRPFVVASSENLGAEPPTGSKIGCYNRPKFVDGQPLIITGKYNLM